MRTFTPQGDQLAASNELLLQSLLLMYDKYEVGESCYEDVETFSGYIGNAVRLSGEEENQILAALESAGIETALTFGKKERQ